MSTMIPYGNLSKLVLVNISASLSQIAANTTGERTFVLPGVLIGSDVIISVTASSPQTGLGIVGARITGNGTAGITFVNVTGNPITPNPGLVYNILIGRIDAEQKNFQ